MLFCPRCPRWITFVPGWFWGQNLSMTTITYGTYSQRVPGVPGKKCQCRRKSSFCLSGCPCVFTGTNCNLGACCCAGCHPLGAPSYRWAGCRLLTDGRAPPLGRFSPEGCPAGNSSRALGLLCNFPQGGYVVGPKQAAACAVVMNTGSIPLGSRPIASVRHHGCQVG